MQPCSLTCVCIHIYTPGNKRVSGYRFRYQLTCPLYTGIFLGNALQLFLGPLTQKQLTCLSSCNWGPWISTLIWDMFRYFWGIDSANNHSHISKPHPLNNTDTLSGRFSMASHPTLSKCNWFLECTPNLPAHPRASSMMRSSGRSWDPFFLHRFVINAVFDLSPIGVWK